MDPPCDALHAALQDMLANAFPSAAAAPGRIFGVETPRCGRWFGATGLAVLDPSTVMTTRHQMNVGSVSEMFVAAVVLQLVSERRLTLDDTLDRWFPEIPRSSTITIRELLSHRSGLPDPMQSAAMTDAWLGQPHTPAELVALVANETPECPPGECHVRSATNFVLLGSIVEALTEGTLEDAIRTRITEPLALADTKFLPVTRPSGLAHSYSGTTDVTGAWHPSNAYGSASLMSSAQDLLTWAHALFEGDLLDGDAKTEMTRFDGIPGVGRFGLALAQLGADTGAGLGMETWYHGGAWEGFSVVAYIPDLHASLVMLENAPAVPQEEPRDELREMFGMALSMNSLLGSVAPAPGCDAIYAHVKEYLEGCAERYGLAMPGSVLGLDSPKCGRWLATTGYAVRTSVPMTPTAVFGVTGVNGTLLAAAALQLIEEGRLSFEDTLPHFGIDGFTYGDRITVRHLLGGWSGLDNYPTRLLTMFSLTSSRTPDQLVDIARDMPPICEPGTCFSHSTSDLLLLAVVLEAATGEDVHDVLRAQIARADGIRSMSFFGEPRPPE